MAKHHNKIYNDGWEDYRVGDVHNILCISKLDIDELIELNKADFGPDNSIAIWETMRRLCARLGRLEDCLGGAENLNDAAGGREPNV
jgi:hypothetical protein